MKYLTITGKSSGKCTNTELQQLTNNTLTSYTIPYDKYYIILINRLVINYLTIIFGKVSTYIYDRFSLSILKSTVKTF